jgi:hypothetical protein
MSSSHVTCHVPREGPPIRPYAHVTCHVSSVGPPSRPQGLELVGKRACRTNKRAVQYIKQDRAGKYTSVNTSCGCKAGVLDPTYKAQYETMAHCRG